MTREFLAVAAAERWVVRFGYEKPDGTEAERVVSPSAVFNTVEGHTLLFGYDHEREAPRQFRIDRITGLPGIDRELGWTPVE